MELFYLPRFCCRYFYSVLNDYNYKLDTRHPGRLEAVTRVDWKQPLRKALLKKSFENLRKIFENTFGAVHVLVNMQVIRLQLY